MPNSQGKDPPRTAEFETFDDDAIRVELRRMVEHFKSEILHKMAAAEDSFRIDAETIHEVSDEFRRKMHSSFEASQSKLSERFQAIFDFIDRR